MHARFRGLRSSPGTDILMTARSRRPSTVKHGLVDVRPQEGLLPEIRSLWGGHPVPCKGAKGVSPGGSIF